MKVSRFVSEFDSHPTLEEIEWSDFAREITTHDFTRTAKRGLPCFSPAEFRTGAPKKNLEAVIAVNGGVLDMDHVTDAQIASTLDACDGLAAALYTTWRHPEEVAKGLNRVRLVVPFSKPVPAADWPAFWPRMVQRLGGICDSQCKDASRIYFGPFMPPGSEDLAASTILDGAPLDVDAVSALALATRDGAPPLRKLRRERLAKIAERWRRSRSDGRQELGETLKKIVDGEAFAVPGERDDTMFRVIAALAKEIPDADPESFAVHWTESLQLCGDDLEGDLVKVAEKYVRCCNRQEGEWHGKLAVNEKGEPKVCVGNAAIYIEHHPAWAEVLGYDERRQVVVFLKSPPWGGEPRDLGNHDGTACAQWFTEKVRLTVSGDVAYTAMVKVAIARAFDPFRDWLEALPPWDGTPRLDTWLIDYAGAEDTPYTRAVSAAWMISAVARTIEPGAKADAMIILESPQGWKKSTLLKTIAGREYFRDDVPTVGTKDAKLALQGPVIVEFPELDAFSKAEAKTTKHWLSLCDDAFRPPYGKVTEVVPRRCVFAGTTNHAHYFVDETGNRRYWPVQVTKRCDLEGAAAAREQLWAEAVARYSNGAQWWLDEWHEALAGREQEKRLEVDAWHEAIATALEQGVATASLKRAVGAAKGKAVPIHVIKPKCETISIGEIATHVLDIPLERQDRRTQIRIGKVMRTLGWERYRGRDGADREWRYRRPGEGAEK